MTLRLPTAMTLSTVGVHALLAVLSGAVVAQQRAPLAAQDELSQSCPADGVTPVASEIPEYAMLSRIHPDVDCSSGDRGDSEDAILVAVWNPTEILERFDPYGLTIERPLFKRLAQADPVAAYMIGLRMERDGQVVAAPDMHFRAASLTSMITPDYAIWSVFGEPDGTHPITPHLKNDQRLQIEFRSELGTGEGPRLVVTSWIGQAGTTQDRSSERSTTITLMAEPSHQAPVVASDAYLAPVYTVVDFAMSTPATAQRARH